MPNAADTTERQKCLFGVARTALSNNRDWLHKADIALSAKRRTSL